MNMVFYPLAFGVYPPNWLILRFLLLIDTLYVIMFLCSQNSQDRVPGNIFSA